MVIRELSKMILGILAAGLLFMLSVVWDSKVSQADYHILKNNVQKDIALIKKDISYIREEAKEIKKILIKSR